jgi:hypothetical protein
MPSSFGNPYYSDCDIRSQGPFKTVLDSDPIRRLQVVHSWLWAAGKENIVLFPLTASHAIHKIVAVVTLLRLSAIRMKVR